MNDFQQAYLQSAGRYMIEHELTWGNAGNISARLNERSFLITASGTRLGDLHDDDLVSYDFSGTAAAPPDDARKPSKEVPMHQAVYEMRSDINAVLHAAPFYSTLLACSTQDIPSEWFVESMYYLEKIARVPYYHPGSSELGQAVRAQATHANVLLLDNHGVLVFDSSVQEALMALHTLEFTCRMVVTARGMALPIRPIPPDTVQSFLHHSGYRPRRRWPS